MASVVIRIGESRSCAPRSTSARPKLAFVLLEVLEVVDHQDPVARGDPEHRVEPDEGAEREDAAADPRCEYSADQTPSAG